jgi:lipopolysaccharide export system permease protein
MTLFDRHIARRLLGGYAAFVLALIVFFVVLHYLEYVDDFLDRDASMAEVLRVYYPSYVPEIIRLTSPLALFLSGLYLTTRLSAELQLTALYAAGVSLGRILRPFLLVALLVAAVQFWMGGYLVPHTQRTVIAFEAKYLGDGATQPDVSDLHRQNATGSYLTVGFYSPGDTTAYRVTLADYDERAQPTALLSSTRMEWADSLGVWRLYDGVQRRYAPDGSVSLTRFQVLDTLLNIRPRDLAQTERDVETMTVDEAQAHLAQLRRTGSGNLRVSQVGLLSKFTYPLAHLALALLCVPLGAPRRRGGAAVAFGVGLLLALIYLALQKIVEPFGYTGLASPLFVTLMPHVVFAGVGLVLFWRARR